MSCGARRHLGNQLFASQSFETQRTGGDRKLSDRSDMGNFCFRRTSKISVSCGSADSQGTRAAQAQGKMVCYGYLPHPPDVPGFGKTDCRNRVQNSRTPGMNSCSRLPVRRSPERINVRLVADMLLAECAIASAWRLRRGEKSV